MPASTAQHIYTVQGSPVVCMEQCNGKFVYDMHMLLLNEEGSQAERTKIVGVMT